MNRVSPQEAFELLLRQHNNGWTAGEAFNRSLHNNDIRLWRDGVLLTPDEIRERGIYARVQLEKDGHWCCTIEERQDLTPARVVAIDDTALVQMLTIVRPPPPVWEAALAGGYNQGTVSRRWTRVVDDELLRLWRNTSPLLQNSEQLYRHLGVQVEQETGHLPKYPKRFRRRIRDFLKVHKPG